MTFAERIGNLTKSQTQEINDRAHELRREGRDLIDLGAGDPRFSEPESARSAGRKAIDDCYTGYTEVGGDPGLRGAIEERYEKVFGIDTKNLTSMATVGAKSALFEIAQVFYEEGDEVILPRPYWVSYSAQVELAGAASVFAPGKKVNHYLPTADEIAGKITPDTKAILVNSPSNPTGGVYSEEQARRVVALARKHDLLLISDECYDGFVYERDRFWSFASSEYERTLVIGSTSKNFAMTGWRLGYILGKPDYIKELEKLQSHVTSSPPAISQKAAEAALRDELTLPRSIREDFRRKRDRLVEGLSAVPGMDCLPPPGSFYLFPDVRGLLEAMNYEKTEDWKLAKFLLEEAGVVTVPGGAFGAPGHLRMAYLPETDSLDDAARQIEGTVRGIVDS
jgi:aspartate aminotransferase